MFTESLLESSGSQQPTHRRWTTAASLMFQIAVIGTLALVPVLRPDALLLVRKPPEIPIFSSSAPPPVTPGAHPVTSAPAATMQAPFIRSNNTVTIGRPQPDGPGTTADPNVLRQIGDNGPGPNLLIGNGFPPPIHEVVPPRPFKLSHVDPASLIRYVKPIYPSIALITHVQGTVTLHALISREGNIESLQLVSGHPLLSRAALDAVKQWRYRPYILNGEPVEVETQITVNFIAERN